jgi:hypothetical protein
LIVYILLVSGVILMDQSPPYVLRSVSLKNVINDDINLQPQNYCVVGGQTVRIRRSQEERRIDEQDIQAKLTHYEGLVRSQKLELEYQNERIGQLEDLLRHLNIEEAIIQRPLLYPQLKNKELRESLMGKNLFDLHRPEGIQVQRERSTTSDETDGDSVFPCSFSVHSTDYVTPKAQTDDNNKFFPTPTHSGSPSSLLDENNSNNTDNNTDNDNAVIIAPLTSKTCPLESTSSPDRSALQLRLSSSISERRKALSSLCGSRSKFGSFRSNKKLTSNTVSSASPSPLTVVNDENIVNNNNNNTHQQESTVPFPQELPFSSSSSSSAAHLVKFPWKEKQEPCLFIYHDNPQLHNNISQFLDSNSFHQMHIMIESHQTKEKAKFLFGFIVFSGSFHEIENANPQDVRGGLCLAVKGLYGVSGNMKSSFTKRNKSNHSDIVEVELMNPQQRKTGGGEQQQQEGQQYYEIKKPMDLELFFSGCCSRVDVILDPYHDDFHWYPYFEGTRKMAPQFRSKGIGYLRLGDDMSNYGTAFLSVDGGRSYLDNGATNITGKTTTGGGNNNNNQDDDCSTVVSWKSDKSTQSHKKKSRGGLTDTIRKLIHTSREGSVDGTNPYVFNNNSSSSGNEEETAIRSQFQEIVIQLAQDNKWTEKVKLIQRFIASLEKKKTSLSAFLSSILENNNNNNSGNGIVFFGFCRCLSDHLSKNMINPKLLAELLKTIEFLVESSSLSLTSSSQDPFFMALLSSFSATAIEGKGIRSFLADVIKLLKNSYTPVIQEKIQKLLFLIFPIHSHLSLNGLADILSEIFPSQSSSVPPSYSKICSFINQFLSQFYRITDGISLNSTVFSSFSSVFLQMIQHRDEGIREFSLQILAMIILLSRIAVGEEDEEEADKKGRLAAILLLQKKNNSGSEEFLQLLSAYQLDTLFNYLKTTTASNKSGEKLMAICAKNLNERQLRSRSSGRSAIRTPGSSSSSRQQKGKAPLKRTLSGKQQQQSQKKENNNNKNSNNNNESEKREEDKSITDSLLRLSNFWFECKLLFKTVPNNEENWKQAFQVIVFLLIFCFFSFLLMLFLCLFSLFLFLSLLFSLQVIHSSKDVFQRFEELSVLHSLPVGQLIRVILPFSEETNSADQADHQREGGNSSQYEDLRIFVSSISDKNKNKNNRKNNKNRNNEEEDEQEEQEHEENSVLLNELISLRTSFISIRKLIRVKMADEADYKQAKNAMNQLETFLEEVETNKQIESRRNGSSSCASAAVGLSSVPISGDMNELIVFLEKNC